MNEFSNLGDQIKNTVQNAVDTMNFDQLNKNITDSVNSALNEVRSHLNINSFSNGAANQGIRDWKVTSGNSQKYQQNSNQNQYQQTNSQYRQSNQSSQYQGQSNAQANSQYNGKATADMWEQRRKAAMERGRQMRREWASREKTVTYQNGSTSVTKSTKLVPSVKQIPGRFLGPTLKGLGYTFGSISALGGIICGGIYSHVGADGLLLAAEICGCVFAANVILGGFGKRIGKRAARFKQYITYIGQRKFCQIEALAAHTGLSKRSVVKDIRKMLQMGLFPQGHLDEKGTCLILDDETYEQYLITSSQFERKKREEAQMLKEEKKAKNTDNSENSELRKTINEGKSYIRQINEANAAIPAIDISEKLSRLEQITSKIFSFVEQHPEQLPELRKFMEYYLPITLKLVNAYKELDAQPIQGDNISSSKREIVKTLDTINMAFENLLDSLYESTAMDVSSDISVLETMFAQDGLTNKDFDLK